MNTIIKILKEKILSLLTICLLGTTSLYCGELNFYLCNLSADSVTNVLLVDKSKQSLFVIRSNMPGNVQVLDSFRITTGKVDGNKEVERDRKTPEVMILYRPFPPISCRRNTVRWHLSSTIQTILIKFMGEMAQTSGSTGGMRRL